MQLARKVMLDLLDQQEKQVQVEKLEQEVKLDYLVKQVKQVQLVKLVYQDFQEGKGNQGKKEVKV